MIVKSNNSNLKHVVIIGAGFAGIEAAKILGNTHTKVTLIDRNNHHVFQPLLYQVATAGLSPADIATPIRSVTSEFGNVDVIMATVTSIDKENQLVILDDGQIPFDFLIVAAGATHSYFGHEEWATLAPGLKSLEDATEIRRRVLIAFERAERYPEAIQTEGLLNFVIVGAGPTGVELAGALAELTQYTLSSDFRQAQPRDSKIILVESGPRILSTFPEELAQKATHTLHKLGVEIMIGKPVTHIEEHLVVVDGKKIPSATVIWAAGVKAASIGKSLGTPLDKSGRVLVNSTLNIPGTENIFVVGDLASITQPNGKPVPGVAPAALQQGKYAAKNILNQIRNKQTVEFKYFDKGNLATVGRGSAIAELGKFRLSGFSGWLLWLFIHIYFLIGFRNRSIVLFQWAVAFFTYERGARLITKDVWIDTVVSK